MRVILASKSPRRRELLTPFAQRNGFEFEVITEETDENLDGEYPYCGVEELAIRKGRAVARKYPDALVISADTLVELDGEALGKPSDASEAEKMLRALSARAHNVYTGIAVHYNGAVSSGVAATEVVFRKIEDGELYEYIASGEPMDKAGAYGIQGYAGRFVEKYVGDFDTVVGFSISLLEKLILECVRDLSSLAG